MCSGIEGAAGFSGAELKHAGTGLVGWYWRLGATRAKCGNGRRCDVHPLPSPPNLPSGGTLFAKDLEVTLSLQGRKVNIGHDPDGDIVEREFAAHSYFSGFLIGVRVGEIAARFIQRTPSSVPPRVWVNFTRTCRGPTFAVELYPAFGRRLVSTGWEPSEGGSLIQFIK